MDDFVQLQIFLCTELFVAFFTFFISHIDIGRIMNFLMCFQIRITCEGFVTNLALNICRNLVMGFSVPVQNIFERERLLANIAQKLMIFLVKKFFMSPQHPFLIVFLETNITFKTCFSAVMLASVIIQTNFGNECFFTRITFVSPSLT